MISDVDVEIEYFISIAMLDVPKKWHNKFSYLWITH